MVLHSTFVVTYFSKIIRLVIEKIQAKNVFLIPRHSLKYYFLHDSFMNHYFKL